MLHAGNDAATGAHDVFLKDMAGYAELGIEEVQMMPWTPNPLAMVDGLIDNVVAELREVRRGPAGR
jgi:hypothetical protein